MASVKKMAGASDLANGVLKTEQVPYWMPRVWYDTIIAGGVQGSAVPDDLVHIDDIWSTLEEDAAWWMDHFKSFAVIDGSHRVTAFRELGLESYETKVLLPIDESGEVMTPEELYLIMQVRNSLPTRKSGMPNVIQNSKKDDLQDLLNLLGAYKNSPKLVCKQFQGKVILDTTKVKSVVLGANEWTKSKISKLCTLANALVSKERSIKELKRWASVSKVEFMYSHFDHAIFKGLTDHETWLVLRSVQNGVFPAA